MGYKLEAEENPVAGFRRVAREQIDAAIAHLDGLDTDDAAAAIHEIRKGLKKTRAVLKLLRRELGQDLYRGENDCLRAAGRALSAARDAEVLPRTLGELGGPAPSELARELDREREHAYDIPPETAERLDAALRETRGRIDAWPLDRADSKLFGKALKRRYKRGRKAFAAAYAEPDPERMHELRKQVKVLWYFSRLLRPAAKGEIGAFEELADEAADLLGLDHDLAVLAAEAREREPDAEDLQTAIAQRRLELQAEALPLLERMFAAPPKAFAARIAMLFDRWRAEQDPLPLRRLTHDRAERVREALAAKQDAPPAEQERIRRRLRAWGVEPSAFAPWTGNRAEFGAGDLDQLIARGIVAVGPVEGPGGRPRPDSLREVDVEIGPNEASGLCPIEDEDVLTRRGWAQGFWVVLDEVAVGDGTVAVGRAPDGRWEAAPLPTTVAGAGTEDGEDCVRVGPWIYIFGSHYGSKEGPLERERQFVARFREADALGPEPVELEVTHTDFRLHRLLNDFLAESGVELWPLAAAAREALVERTAAELAGDDEDGLVEPRDAPLNIEGVAPAGNGAVLIGLRYPVTLEGHPLIIEVGGIARLFSGGLPEPRRVWVLADIGNRWAPAGIRGLAAAAEGDRIDVLTGNLDSTGKGSVLVDAHPEAGLARSAHFRFEIPAEGDGGSLETSFVREFPGERRVEGVAVDRLGRTFYAIDEEARVDLRYCEPVAG